MRLPTRAEAGGTWLFLASLLLAMGCQTTSADLTPRDLARSSGIVWRGTVSVQAAVLPKNANDEGRIAAWVDRDKFHQALSTAITEAGVFSGVARGDAEYVLDVWAYLTAREGLQVTPVYEMDAVWRLTRASDGRVLACDYTHAEAWSGRSISKAAEVVRGTLRDGAALLADSTPRLAALPARLRPSMGPVVTEELRELRRASPGLRKGMTLEEAMQLLDPASVLRASLAQPNRLKQQPEVISGTRYRSGPEGVQLDGFDLTVRDYATTRVRTRSSASDAATVSEFMADAYTLVFLDGQLARWELRGSR
jgi:hypothetical protein